MIDFERAKKDPAGCFDRPSAVLEAPDLSRKQKIEVLRQWEYDVLQLQVATEENMPADTADHAELADIHRALESLGSRSER